MRKTLAIVILFLAAAGLHAQDAASVAMPFSIVPRNVRTLSTGGLTTADAVAVRLLGDTGLDVNASWYSWAPQGASSNNINADAFVRLSNRLALSAQFGMDIAPRYDIYDAQGTKGGFYSPKDMLVKLGAAYRITPVISVGADLRYMNSSLTSKVSYSAFGADVIAAATFGGAKVAAGVTNLGTSVKASDGTAFGIPAAATLAGKYNVSFAEKHSVDAGAQVDFFFKGGLRAGLGVEYGFNGLVFARVGYSLGLNSPFPTYLSLGLGAKFSGISINAAYLVGSSAIGNTLAIGAGYSF
ncbi:MAG: hypothetical protein IJU68_03765 [Bacteroidales bacterium]|nr:hypothetical protein [Bacteroidales bacterium]